jgi:hypothetical protein
MTRTSVDLRYPIGPFVWPQSLTVKERDAAIAAVARAPSELRSAISGLTDSQLDTPYRPDGWTVRQVVHHVPDSHLNAYSRFKLALTEDYPTIKPYKESAWAELADGNSKLIDASLTLLEGLHARWVFLLERMKPAEFDRRVKHPEHDRVITLDMLLAMYAWHGKHHVAHITGLRDRSGW